MTIIQPNKHRDTKKLILILGSLLVGIFLMGVFVFIQTVSLEHDLSKAKLDLEQSKVDNAEIKNEYYSYLDADNLEALAAERGLIQDKNPKWAFESGL